ncbi:DUF6276 family protein [Halopiger goleimassiliensis]|uniref:DUF6276 family protein n=1 Tax=Halopiger goleimassiliensis TaxID=1293048 RepID=UPI00067788F6|nr:DUF6276 family protein [Halopiger goleimassiliensis]
MACPECGSDPLLLSVPESYREYAPGEAAVVAFCPDCLALEAVDDAGGSAAPDFSRVSDAFPTKPDRAIPLALALGLASSLATNREAIESLLRATERAGADPLLVIDRLVADPTVEPAIDLERRAHQLEQLLY